jgi:hypothetical protein
MPGGCHRRVEGLYTINLPPAALNVCKAIEEKFEEIRGRYRSRFSYRGK